MPGIPATVASWQVPTQFEFGSIQLLLTGLQDCPQNVIPDGPTQLYPAGQVRQDCVQVVLVKAPQMSPRPHCKSVEQANPILQLAAVGGGLGVGPGVGLSVMVMVGPTVGPPLGKSVCGTLVGPTVVGRSVVPMLVGIEVGPPVVGKSVWPAWVGAELGLAVVGKRVCPTLVGIELGPAVVGKRV